MSKILRKDLQIISELIKNNEKVLDVGCGDGHLLQFLSKKKNAECRGIEIKQTGVNNCVRKGLSVIQGDANYDLLDYPDKTFSTVILSQTIQAMIFPEKVIENLIRIGTRAIISFPNFGYWRIRRDFLIKGKMPKNKILPYQWYDTPNIHLCSFRDFKDFCLINKITIEDYILLNESGLRIQKTLFPNFFSSQVIFCVSKK